MLGSFRDSYLSARPIVFQTKPINFDFYHLNTNDIDYLYSTLMEVSSVLTSSGSKSHISIFTDRKIGSNLEDFYKLFPMVKFVNNVQIMSATRDPKVLLSYLRGQPIDLSSGNDDSSFHASNIDSILGNTRLYFTIKTNPRIFKKGDFVLYKTHNSSQRRLEGAYILGDKSGDKWKIIKDEKIHTITESNILFLDPGSNDDNTYDDNTYDVLVKDIGASLSYTNIIDKWNKELSDSAEMIDTDNFTLSKPSENIENQLATYMSLFNITDTTYKGKISNNQHWYVFRIN